MARPVRRGSRATLTRAFLLHIAIFSLSSLATAPVTSASPPARRAYVVSANDAALTRVDLDSGDVLPHVATVGALANRIEVDAERMRALVVNSGSDDVTVFDAGTENVLGVFELPSGANPWAAEMAGGRLFVSALLHDRVYEIDPDTGSILSSIPVGRAPEGLAVAGGFLFVANTGFDFGDFSFEPGTVSVIDLATSTVIATIDVSLNPQECVATADGAVHVVCTGDFGGVAGAIDVIGPGSFAVSHTFPVDGYPGSATLHPSGTVFLGVTTPTFASEIHGYDASSFAWQFDATNPLLPSFDFYGNVRTTSALEFLVPDFSGDLLLAENPGDPGTPRVWIVGDGAIDVAVFEGESPVPTFISGLSGEATADGVRLAWRAAVDADVVEVIVERRTSSGAWRNLAVLAPTREGAWLDRDVLPGNSATWRIGARGQAGDVQWTSPLTVGRPVLPERLALERPFPNPARASTHLAFRIPARADVTVDVFDAAGRRVRTLARGARDAGRHELVWNGRDDTGQPVAAGVYLIRVDANGDRVADRVLRTR
ncbi:MAG: FlgD immunoglobulin-like domain containing protein [bacterium]